MTPQKGQGWGTQLPVGARKGGTGQGWRCEVVVGGWMDARKDGRMGHRKQEKQNGKRGENNDKKTTTEL